MRRNIIDRKSTRLNSSHLVISYAVFCLKKKKEKVMDLVEDDDGLQRACAVLRHEARATSVGRNAGVANLNEEDRAGLFFFFFFLRMRDPRISPLFPPPPLFR